MTPRRRCEGLESLSSATIATALAITSGSLVESTSAEVGAVRPHPDSERVRVGSVYASARSVAPSELLGDSSSPVVGVVVGAFVDIGSQATCPRGRGFVLAVLTGTASVTPVPQEFARVRR